MAMTSKMPASELHEGPMMQPDLSLKGPLAKERTPTEARYLTVFIIFCVFWLYIATYADYESNRISDQICRKENELNNAYSYSYTPRWITPFDDIESLSFVGWPVICALMCTLYVALLKSFTRTIISLKVVLVFTVLFTIALILAASYIHTPSRYEFFVSLVVVSTIFVVLVLLFIVHRQKVVSACKIIKETSQCVAHFPSVFLWLPSLMFAVLYCVFLFAVTIYYRLKFISRQNNEMPDYIKMYHAVNILGVLWIGTFMHRLSQMIIAGTMSTWYWTENKTIIPDHVAFRVTRIIIKNHVGTLTYGSLIIPVYELIKLFLNITKILFEWKYSPFACNGWYQYLFGNLDKVVRPINQNIFVMCALHGSSFYDSANNAHNLLMKNITKVIKINCVFYGILILGQVLLISLSGGLEMLVIPNVTYKNLELAWGLFIIAIFMSEYFLSAIKTALNTIFFCIFEDLEMNNETSGTPQFMTSELKDLFLIH